MRKLRRIVPFFFVAPVFGFVTLAPAQTRYLRSYFIQYVPVGSSSTYGECSYFEFPGEDGVLGTEDDQNLLVDGGRSSYAYDVLIPFLQSRIGAGGTIWHMLLSSPGEDHFGGLEVVVDEFTVRYYYENVRWPAGDKPDYDSLIAALQDQGASLYTFDAGDWLSGPSTNIGPGWDPYVSAKVICADADAPYAGADDNQWSPLIQIRCGESVFLTGGDALGGSQETWVVNETSPHSYAGARGELADTDIYKVHHHGGKYSSYQTFMDRMTPLYAVAQMAYGYGPGSHSHPTKEALDRIWRAGGIAYRNDLDGTVLVKCDSLGNFDIIRARAYVDETQTPGGSNELVEAPPAIPQDLQVTEVSDTSVSLEWADVSGAYGYDAYRSTISNGDPGAGLDANPDGVSTGIYEKPNPANIVSSQYTDTGLTPGTTYYYRVSSKKLYTESGYQTCYERRYSSEVAGTTSGGENPTPTPWGWESPTPSPTATPAAAPFPTCSITPAPAATSLPIPTPSPPPTPFPLTIASSDYDGDGLSDAAIFRPTSGLWFIRGFTRFIFGQNGDVPAPADYDGDGTTEAAVFRPNVGLWAIRDLTRIYWGKTGDGPVAADFDGDGTSDPAILRPPVSQWKVRGITSFYFGNSDDFPLPDDWNGDGTAEGGVFRPAIGQWMIREITRGYLGSSGDTPVWGDTLGDGIARKGVFRPSDGLWAFSEANRLYFGRRGDIPLLLQSDSNPDREIAVFRAGASYWAIRDLSSFYFGVWGDIPVTR